MTNDVVLNKIAIIQRCLGRIAEEFGDEREFRSNFTKQDSVILNLQRACEAAIDMANYKVREHKLGVPQSARDSFDMLHNNGLLDESLASSMKSMVGLRNIAVHNYQQLNMDILVNVLRNHLQDFNRYCRCFVG